ncbi:MAG: alpha-amylase family glycosyl hydrolase [Candidatus Limivivens sp.]|nr:alpha-amylase family glycosyl hydrolase [Candidatus Limivivens sp.]
MNWQKKLSGKGQVNERMKNAKEFETAVGTYNRLGVTRDGGSVNFAVMVKEDVPVSLILYEKGKAEVLTELSFPENSLGKIRAMKIKGLKTSGLEYNFRIGEQVIQDPCAARITGREKFGVPVENEDGHQIRCGFLNGTYSWEGDQKPLKIPYEDAVIYHLHVRGFTMQKGSGVRHRGTFAGVKEKADYLADLGVRQIKLAPAYEFDEIMPVPAGMKKYVKDTEPQKLNYWGYIAGNYFAPKASYAASMDPVTEFRDMVKTFHRKGIEVLMDFYFPAGTSPQLALSCLTYWVQEYHVDGFQLLGDAFISQAAAREPALADTKLLSTYFPTEEIYGPKTSPDFRNLGECNDGFLIDTRKFLKGDEEQLKPFIWRMRRNPENAAVVNYMAGHDGFTLMDAVSYDERHNEENGEQGRDGNQNNYSWNCGAEGPTKKKKILELRQRQMKNAFTMMLLSAGTPMLLAGDEFGNSQGGNNNPYCIDSPVTWLDWSGLRRNCSLWNYVRDLIAFRKAHRILHMKTELKGVDSLSCGYPDISYHGSRAWYGAFENNSRQVGMLYCGQYAKEDEFLYVAYNLHWNTQTFALPALPGDRKWFRAVSTETGVAPAGEETMMDVDKTFEVPPRTVVVLIGREESQHDVSSD